MRPFTFTWSKPAGPGEPASWANRSRLLEFHLGLLPESGRWRRHDHPAGTVGLDRTQRLNLRYLAGTALAAEHPASPDADANDPRAAALTVTWTPTTRTLVVESVVGNDQRVVHLESLDLAHSFVADALCDERSVPQGTSPGHHVRSYDGDIVQAAAALLRLCPRGPGAERPANDVLVRLADLKAASDDDTWHTLTRLGPTWNHSLEDLLATARAVAHQHA